MVCDVEPLMSADDAAVMRAAAEAASVGGDYRRPVTPTVAGLSLTPRLTGLQPYAEKVYNTRQKLC